MNKEQGRVLCASSAYEKKYYFNDKFEMLPISIQDEIKIIAVLFTEEVSGVFSMEFNEKGSLILKVKSNEDDFLFDDIASELKVREIIENNKELFASLELFYKTFMQGGL